MAGRFSFRRSNQAEPGFVQDEPAPGEVATIFAEPAPPEPVVSAPNSLLSDKLLDAKVRLHRRLIEEINLQALEKLPEDEIRAHVMQLVSQYIVVERLPLALGILLPLLGTRRVRRRLRQIPPYLGVALFAVLSLAAVAGLSGCSGAGLFAARKVPYTITVTATEGTVQRSTEVALAIQ